MRDGRLGFVRLAGGGRRIPATSIDHFLEQNLIAAR
jgi:excisionase family DNA binding protein